MLDRNERTIVSWENDKSSPARLVASSQPETMTVEVQIQTPETSVAFSLSRGSLCIVADFLAAIADEVETWEDVTVEPDAPADDTEGTVA